MLKGHGDDIYRYERITMNFSSNVYAHFDHSGLFAYLAERLPLVKNYPSPTAEELVDDIADALGIDRRCVSVTNGATEAIYLVAQTFAGEPAAVLAPAFAEYADACEMYSSQVRYASSLNDIDAECKVVWLCNPCNPTGAVMDKTLLLDYVKEHPEKVFVIDASYAPYTMCQLPTARELLRPNVLMLHSMTKEFGIPGLRLGYVTGMEEMIIRIDSHRMPWSVNQLAIDAGRYLLAHKEDYAFDLSMLMEERRRVGHAMQELGITVSPSDTHILLAELPHGSAAELKDRLARQHGILVRDASNFHSLTDRHFRIAVQRPEENDCFLAALEKFRRS